MKRRSVAVLLAVCLSAGSLLAASPEDSKQTFRPPTTEELRTVQALATQFGFTKALKTVAHANGTVTVGLDARYDHTYIVTTDENGNLLFSCIDDPAVAHAVVNNVDTIMRLRPETKTRAAEKE